jgi:hypothetical protein
MIEALCTGQNSANPPLSRALLADLSNFKATRNTVLPSTNSLCVKLFRGGVVRRVSVHVAWRSKKIVNATPAVRFVSRSV